MRNPFTRGLTLPSFFGAATLATLCGSAMMAGFTMLSANDWETAIAFPSLTLLFSFYAFLFVLGGLLIFGLPAADLFERFAKALWLWPVSIVLGAAAGCAVMYVFGVIAGDGWPMAGGLAIGATYGAWSGVWWCYVCKRRLGTATSAPDEQPEAETRL